MVKTFDWLMSSPSYVIIHSQRHQVRTICGFLYFFGALLAGDQRWPRTSSGRLRLAHAITRVLHHKFGHFVKGKKETPAKRLIKFSAREVKGKKFYQHTLMATSLHFRRMTTFQTHIIKYRNKCIQIAVVIYPYHEKL